MIRAILVLLVLFSATQEIDAGPFGRFQRGGRKASSGGRSGYLSFPKSTPPATPCSTGNCPRPALTAAPTIQTQVTVSPENPQALIGTKVFIPSPTTSTTMEVKLSNLEQAKAALAKAEAEVKAALAEERHQASREEVAIRAEYALQKLDNQRALEKIKASYDAMRLKAGLAPVDGVPPVPPVEGDK